VCICLSSPHQIIIIVIALMYHTCKCGESNSRRIWKRERERERRIERKGNLFSQVSRVFYRGEREREKKRERREEQPHTRL
jgi:hypothetical protein